ncbi:MAG: tRNA adenosine(34) deaminase TadA [Tissierellia bacterium]|nr:tRNA adenosine(34) deaminase TadA [Tissierellia bacterium]
MKTKEDFMREALREAQKARDLEEVPIGCVIVKDGEIIGRGYNQVESREDPTCHAEMVAIRQAVGQVVSWRLVDCDIYVTLEPCPMCMGAILSARLDKLYIGAKNPRYGACGSVLDLTNYQAFNHAIQVEKGLLQEEAGQMMRDFFRDLRKKKQGEA